MDQASRFELNSDERMVHIVAFFWILALTVSVALSALEFRGLYADGSYFFLKILTERGFFYAAPSRAMSYWLTQSPLVISLTLGIQSIDTLGRIHTLGLAAVPVAAYAWSIWLARNSLVFLAGTAGVISAVYFPPALFAIGEFNVSFSLYWLAAVALLSDTKFGRRLACVLAMACLLTYDASAILGALMGGITVWRALHSSPKEKTSISIATAILFFLGSALGIASSIYLPNLSNAGPQFREALIHFSWNIGAWTMLGLSLTSFMVAVFLRGWGQFLATIAVAIVVSLALFYVVQINPDRPGLGIPYNIRPVSFIGLAIFIVAVFLTHEVWHSRKPTSMSVFVVSLPLLAMFLIDVRSTIGWSRYLNDFCQEIANTNGTTLAPAFHARPDTVRYGWMWTDPFMSLALRPSGSDAMILNNPAQVGGLPGLEEYKRNHARLCNP